MNVRQPERSIRFRRTVRPGDAPRIRQLTKATGFFNLEETALAAELVDERLERGVKSGYHFILADRGPKLVGYACFGPIPCTLSSFDLYWIVVHPSEQGRGLGRLLLHQVEASAVGRGALRLYADTSSRAQYAPTRRFYESVGFTAAGVFQNFYAEEDDKVVYAKTLSPVQGREAA
jgi:GNAT superfamily N-acetyltransferase